MLYIKMFVILLFGIALCRNRIFSCNFCCKVLCVLRVCHVAKHSHFCRNVYDQFPIVLKWTRKLSNISSSNISPPLQVTTGTIPGWIMPRYRSENACYVPLWSGKSTYNNKNSKSPFTVTLREGSLVLSKLAFNIKFRVILYFAKGSSFCTLIARWIAPCEYNSSIVRWPIDLCVVTFSTKAGYNSYMWSYIHARTVEIVECFITFPIFPE